MAVFCASQFFLFLMLSVAGTTYAALTIVEPHPAPIYPVEYTSAQVSCIAADPEGKDMPAKIEFVKLDRFNTETNLTAESNFQFTSKKEDNGRKLIVTMHILNVTMAWDNGGGQYECRAYKVGNDTISKTQKYVVNVNVVRVSDLPKVTVSKVGTVKHDDTFTLFCNLTFKGNGMGLEKITWFKDGVNLTDPVTGANIKESISLKMKNIGMKDAGTYTCILDVLLKYKDAAPYQVNDSTTLTISPWFKDKATKEVATKLGENVTLECGARGFPLIVEWKFKNETDEKYKPCIDSSTDDRYKVTQKGPYDPYHLTVMNLGQADFGVYYCCLPSNCSEEINEDTCHPFELGVGSDPTAGSRSVASHNAFLILAFFMLSLFLS